MADKLDSILKKHVAQGNDTANKVLGASLIVTNENGISLSPPFFVVNHESNGSFVLEVLYFGSAGRTKLALDAPKFATDSFSWVASLTKLITCVCVLQIVERGLIGLDDDVRPLVPELASAQILKGFGEENGGAPILVDNTTPITLRNLLTHTIGQGYDVGDPDLMRWSQYTGRTVNTTSSTREGWNTPLKFEPGKGWYYGTAIDWAGLALEVLTGTTLGEYMQQHIFDPLCMDDTTFHPLRPEIHEKVKDRQVSVVYRGEDGTLAEGPLITPLEPPVESGGSGIFTTAADYFKFLQAMLLEIKGKGMLLKKESVDEMFRPQLDAKQQEDQAKLLVGTGWAPEFDELSASEMNWGLAGAINLVDLVTGRKKGSMMWAGVVNPHWFIDPTTGIAAVLVISILPFGDSVSGKLWRELETAIYGDLIPSIGSGKD
ncbi:beta-lactamase/transpeptidase-like protein [Triangularia verruculosa]|uniref:Beta-lactamase/transpeptidase-like protein n=1 Tax=Triangularia verruculosa TaxID=2587418 RepID=A0AAN6XBK0_9PEZI|nr:beta-lactamase/transpeptidase-like protein [Triangularia verruculosa]